ncbi:hypothetical protein BB561_001278 [Smittium simulii]|uniref:ERT1/acuK family PAS domain-containing protein n=1 Tax=Smittium simulii TaxID=133385 RepID=A0A2T9YVE0_9FUNG|nr:hypothetical protein BB561_001278 [Smittium simulii]
MDNDSSNSINRIISQKQAYAHPLKLEISKKLVTKSTKRQHANKKAAKAKAKQEDSFCLKCCIVGKNCKCVKKKKKVAKYLMQDCLEAEQLNQRKTLNNANLFNLNVPYNSKTISKHKTKQSTSSFVKPSSIITKKSYLSKLDSLANTKTINLENQIMSEILEFYLNVSPDNSSGRSLKLPDLPDLSSFCEYWENKLLKNPHHSDNSIESKRIADNPTLSSFRLASAPINSLDPDFWIKAGFTAPNVIKPTLDNILLSTSANFSDSSNFCKNISLSPTKITAQDSETRLRAYNMLSYLKNKLDNESFFLTINAIMFACPSYMSQRMSLSEQDIARIEMSRVRLLKDLERLLEFTATPVATWKPTGEITLVSREFTLLTWWKKEISFNDSKSIFELIDSKSIVDYWQQYSIRIFQSSYNPPLMRCTLLRPDKSVINCAFSFSIKRDLFGSPMEVVGSNSILGNTPNITKYSTGLSLASQSAATELSFPSAKRTHLECSTASKTGLINHIKKQQLIKI